MSQPSRAALEHSCYDREDVFGDGKPSYSPEAEQIVRDAHDLCLGPQRSVCLDDVLQWLESDELYYGLDLSVGQFELVKRVAEAAKERFAPEQVAAEE